MTPSAWYQLSVSHDYGGNFHRGQFLGVNFLGGNFQGCDFQRGALSKGGTFIGGYFHRWGAIFHGGNFHGARLQIFFKKGVIKNFVNFTGKNLRWSLFLIKFKSYSNTDVFP